METLSSLVLRQTPNSRMQLIALPGILISPSQNWSQLRMRLRLPLHHQTSLQLGLCIFVKSLMDFGSVMTAPEILLCGSITSFCSLVVPQTFLLAFYSICSGRVFSLILLLLTLMLLKRMAQILLCGHSSEGFQIYCLTSTQQMLLPYLKMTSLVLS